MDRNPENRADTQNAARGRSGIMMRDRVVNSAKNEEEQQDDEENISRGTKLLKGVLMPWDNTDRIFFTDSYFASVSDAEELWKHGPHFIDVIKITTQQFPLAYLSNIEFHNQGYMSGLLAKPVDSTKLVLGAFVWMDRNRWYLIFTQV